MKLMTQVILACGLLLAAATAQEAEQPAIGQDALDKLKLPGIKIDAKQKHVDVDATICLDEGALELIACTKDTKEHEAVVVLETKAVHIHMALLLIGATPGNPVMQKEVGEGEEKRWMFFPARGQPVRVSLVIKDEQGNDVEKPINEFLQRINEENIVTGEAENAGAEEKFPTNTFLFMGSLLVGNGEGPRRYLAEESGNVITIATFGDEMLGLPEKHSHENGDLTWEVNTDTIPEVGTKVVLRLTPVFAQEQPKNPAETAPAEDKPAAK